MSGCNVGPVIFDYAAWAAQYPELASYIPELQAQGYFDLATLYVNNTVSSPIWDASPGGARTMILYLLTSHVAALFAGGPPTAGAPNGTPASPLVGRITNATEGSVSVAADMPNQPMAAAWFMQTRYGAAAWAAMAPYRTMRYFPGTPPYLGVIGPWGGVYGGLG